MTASHCFAHAAEYEIWHNASVQTADGVDDALCVVDCLDCSGIGGWEDFLTE